MQAVTILLLAVGLSMDAFAVAVCKGLAMGKSDTVKCSIVGAWFGIFQMIMPLAGYFLSISLAGKIERFDHWIAFALLMVIGLNMIREALSKNDEETDPSLKFTAMFVLAVATSIDALASGIALACDGTVNIFIAAPSIGAVTFILSFIGVKIGNVFGTRYKAKAEVAGGAILVILAVKVMLEHMLKGV